MPRIMPLLQLIRLLPQRPTGPNPSEIFETPRTQRRIELNPFETFEIQARLLSRNPGP
jgi:hypothetical protein